MYPISKMTISLYFIPKNAIMAHKLTFFVILSRKIHWVCNLKRQLETKIIKLKK